MREACIGACVVLLCRVQVTPTHAHTATQVGNERSMDEGNIHTQNVVVAFSSACLLTESVVTLLY